MHEFAFNDRQCAPREPRRLRTDASSRGQCLFGGLAMPGRTGQRGVRRQRLGR